MLIKYVYRVEPSHLKIINKKDSNNPSSCNTLYANLQKPKDLGGVDDKKYDTETLFETVRKELFPNKPSRISCIFAFSDIVTAKRFRDSKRSNPGGVISKYIVERNDSIHIADMDLINAVCCLPSKWKGFKYHDLFKGKNLKEAQRHLIKMYWESKPLSKSGGMTELLIYGCIKFDQIL